MIGILTDENGDVMLDLSLDSEGKIKGMKIGNNTADIVERCLICTPGEVKHAPTIGVNIRAMIAGPQNIFAPAKIIEQLKILGIKVNRVQVSDSEIAIDYND